MLSSGPLQDEIDLSGWDVRKALQLFQKSNPPLLEWLQCPIIYRERFSFAARPRELLPDFYSPRACFFHYLHMARGNIREYLQGETVWRKKYFYVLRPLLAMRWIDQELGPVPIEFQKLVVATVQDARLRAALDNLVAAKRAGAELDRGPRIPALSDFIATNWRALKIPHPTAATDGKKSPKQFESKPVLRIRHDLGSPSIAVMLLPANGEERERFRELFQPELTRASGRRACGRQV